jgi:hypothetical protein
MILRKVLAVALCFTATAVVVKAGAADAPKNAPINACALLSDAEVSAAVGSKVTAGERKDAGDVSGKGDVGKGTYSSTCFWRFVTDGKEQPNDPNKPMGGASFAILNAMQWPAGSGEAKKFLESFYDAAKNGVIDQTPVALKIADDAIWWGDGVAVRKGDRSFGISVHIPDQRPKLRAMEEALAKKIAPRL